MRHRAKALVTLAVLLTVLLPTADRAGGGLEGRWTLVEQHYETGGANLAPSDSPVRLEFRRDGTRLVALVGAGEKPAEMFPWPAFVAGGRMLEVEELERGIESDRARVRYRVVPSDAEPTRLEIVEDYRLVDDGAALAGTFRATFLVDGETRGGFTLRRRFERAP